MKMVSLLCPVKDLAARLIAYHQVMSSKRCPRCDSTKSFNEFNKNKSRKDGLSIWCKNCNGARYRDKREEITAKNRAAHHANKEKNNAYSRAYAAAHREEAKLRALQWAKDNPDKVLARNASRRALKKRASIYLVTHKDIRKIKSQACHLCGTRENIQVDHIIPLAKGGIHSVGNLLPLCGRCNLAKSDSFLVVYKSRIRKEHHGISKD
jgi:5-methylcytosine-specific restriction endonuclease McrA